MPIAMLANRLHLQACLFACLVLPGPLCANSFEQNLGQGPAAAEFLVRFAGTHLLVEQKAMEFRLRGHNVVRWEWIGAMDRGGWIGLDANSDTSSYYLGSDPAHWVRSAANYTRIIRRDLYPGIDQIAYISGSGVEYDLVLRAGADPACVRLQVRGGRTKLGADGALRTTIDAGEIVQSAPATYQIVDGVRVPVFCRFVPAGLNVFRLDLGEYRPALPLYVDPTIRVVLAVLGNDDDRVVASTDTTTVGVTRSADWKRAPGGDSDVFVRFRSGNSVKTVFWGGEGDDEVTGFSPGSGFSPVAVIVGWTTSKNLPILGNYDIRPQKSYGGGESDGFLAMLDLFGNQYSTYVGGNGRDRLYSVAVTSGPSGTAYVAAGETNSTGWSEVQGDLRSRGGLDALIVKVSKLGIEAMTLGGSGDDRATAIAVSADSVIAVAGDSSSDDFRLPSGQPAARTGLADAWLARLQWQDQPQVLTAAMWGGSGDERVGAVAYSPDGNLYVAGTTTSSDYPVLNAAQPQFGGGASDGFIARFGPADVGMLNSTFFGGSGRDEILAAAVRGTDLLLGGATDSPDLANVAPAGGMDGFFAHVDPTGRKLLTTLLGGPDDDRVLSVQPLQSGEARVAGWTRSRAWLQALGPEELEGGTLDPRAGTTDGFAATIAYSYATAPDQQIGKDLQVALPLTVFSEVGADGVLVVRSADPGKLLVSTLAQSPGAEQVTVFDADARSAAVYLQALDSAGDVDVILSGQFYPERRVRVHLLPSAVFATQTEVSLSAIQTSVDLTLFVAPVDERTGTALARQAVRAGLDPMVGLASPDETGLRPINRSAPNLTFSFEILKPGTYLLTPSSPVFPTATGQRIRLQVGGGDGIGARLWLARDGRAGFPYDVMGQTPLRLISEDPSRVLLSPQNGGTPQGSLDLSAPTGVYVDALSDSGTVAVRVEGPNNYQAKVLFALSPGQVNVTPAAALIPVDGIVTIALELHPLGAAPSGFTTPPQWIRPGASFGPGKWNGNILQLETFSLNFNFAAPAWVFGFRGLRAGGSDVEPSIPDGAIAVTKRANVQVQPGTISFSRPTLDIPEGFGLILQPVVFLGTHASTAVQLTIRDPKVADVSFTAPPAPSATVNFTSSYYVILRANGKAGQTTSLTLAAQGVDTMEIPVRIVRPVLIPDAQEYWINGQTYLVFQIRALDPDTSQPENTYIYNSTSGKLPVQIQSSSSVCQFDSDLLLYSGTSFTLSATCVAEGDTTIQVQPVANFAPTPTNASVHIVSGTRSTTHALSPYGQPFQSRVFTGNSLQAMLEVPYGFNSEITLTSSDPSKLLLSLDPVGPGQESVKTSSLGKVWFLGFASEGTVPVTADIAGVGRVTITAFLMPSTIAVTSGLTAENGLRELQRTITNGPLGFAAIPALVEPATGTLFAPGTLAIRADIDPVILPGISSNPDVLEPQPPSPLFTGGSTYQPLTFRAHSAGVVDLSVRQPDGFVAAPASVMRVHVVRPTLTLNRARVGKDLQSQLTVNTSLGGLTPGLAITITSLDPDKLLVSSAADTPGQSTLTLTNSLQFYAQGLVADGPAQVRLQAPGYDDAVVLVDFLPVVLAADSFQLTGVSPGGSTNLRLQLGLSEFGRIAFDWNGSVRPGVTIPVTVRPADDSIVQLTGSGTFVFQAGGPSSCYFPIGFLRPGDTQILIETSSSIPLATDHLTVHVANWRFSVSSAPYSLGRFLMAPLQFRNPRQDPVNATLSSSTGVLLFSTDRLTAGNPSLTVNLAGNAANTVYVEGAGPSGQTVVNASAPDFDPELVRLQIVDPGIWIGGPNNSGLTTPLSAGSVTVLVVLGSGDYSQSEQALGASQAAITVKLRSSDPGVVRVGVDSLDFHPGESSRPLLLQLMGKGTALITTQSPAGFNLPTGTRDYLVTVR
ncbi:MAG TPA: hypothetical protein VEU96_30750 [Bryobacteraceae bacterium]|nr:hypothetical protein [Bryobacteraceae bacterium]